MIDAHIVANNPNPKAMTLAFDTVPECFRPFNRLSVDAADFTSSSPFAKYILDTGRKDISRMDFVQRGHGGELSFIGKLPWTGPRGTDPRPLETFNKWGNKTFLNNPTSIISTFNHFAAPDPARDLIILTNEVLNNPEIQEKLAQDGGDILLIDAIYDTKNNSFSVEIALLGSCSGCDQASLQTLKGIESRLIAATRQFNQDFCKNAAEGHPYRTINFTGLKTRDIKGSFYSLNPNYTPPKKKIFGIF
ncbi:MAG: hypothetical protein COB76_05640 [Alphaproteobacteria bacterium]|nr:MAG: hypothetical protein COB76_05640 [Alphaproteobacteria bacterium]